MTNARRALLVSMGVILALYLWIAASSTLWDRDEPRYARATLEMVRSGDYVVPTFNGALRADKPILIYWLMSVPVRIFGPSEVAVRLVSPIAVLVTCVLIFRFAARRLDAESGWMAALLYPLCPLTVASGTAATTDAVLVACITGSLLVAAAARSEGFSAGKVLGFGGLLGLALLTKGPVGLALPALVLMGMLVLETIWRMRPRWGSWLGYLLVASLLGVLIFVAWGIPANMATGGEFAQKGLGRHVVERVAKPLETHGGPNPLWALFYLPILLVGFFPGILFLPAGLARWLRKGAGTDWRRPFLLSWFLAPVVLMSFVATKLPHYILPVWPALSLIAADAVRRAETGAMDAAERTWNTAGRRLFTLTGALLGLALMAGPWFDAGFDGLRLSAAALGILILAMTFVGWREHRAGRFRSAFLSLAAGMVFFFAVATSQLVPRLERFKLSAPIARAVAAETDSDVPVASFGYFEPSLVYYLDRPVTRFREEEEVARWLSRSGPKVVVTTRRRFEALSHRMDSAELRTLGAVSGINISVGKQTDLVAVLKEAS